MSYSYSENIFADSGENGGYHFTGSSYKIQSDFDQLIISNSTEWLIKIQDTKNIIAKEVEFLGQMSIYGITNKILIINSGETGNGITSPGQAGIVIDRGSKIDYAFIFDEFSQSFRIGESGDTQAVATRSDTMSNSGIPYWTDEYMFKNSSSFTFDDQKNNLYTPNTIIDGGLHKKTSENSFISTTVNNGFFNSSNITGAIKIEFPIIGDNNITFDLSLDNNDINENRPGGNFSFKCATNTGSSNWNNNGVLFIPKPGTNYIKTNYQIRFCYDNNKWFIFIGETSYNWSNVNIQISNLSVHNSNEIEKWMNDDIIITIENTIGQEDDEANFILNSTITKQEILNAAKTLKTNKSPGLDGVIN